MDIIEQNKELSNIKHIHCPFFNEIEKEKEIIYLKANINSYTIRRETQPVYFIGNSIPTMTTNSRHKYIDLNLEIDTTQFFDIINNKIELQWNRAIIYAENIDAWFYLDITNVYHKERNYFDISGVLLKAHILKKGKVETY